MVLACDPSYNLRVHVFTIGHSSRSSREFAQLLQKHGIERLVDARSFPASRKFPHFSQDNLISALQEIDISYHHLRAFGGYRKSDLKDSPNQAWKSPGFRAYADYTMTQEFHMALDTLVMVRDERKGESLVVIHTYDEEKIPEVLENLGTMGLPNLFVPRKDRFLKVDELPMLGTGKMNLREIKRMAAEHFTPSG